MRDIYSMLRRPKPIVQTAEKFIQEIIAPQDTAREYMAVHWRFEAGGGEFGGKVQSLCRTQNSRCEKILNLHNDPEGVAGKILLQMAEWNLSVVYISAPPDVSHFIEQLILHIRDRGYRGYSGEDLAKFAGDCFSGDPQVFSSLEQEVCSQSMGFLYSPGSSWSLNTAIERNCRMQTMHASLESILEFGSTKNANSNDTANSSN